MDTLSHWLDWMQAHPEFVEVAANGVLRIKVMGAGLTELGLGGGDNALEWQGGFKSEVQHLQTL